MKHDFLIVPTLVISSILISSVSLGTSINKMEILYKFIQALLRHDSHEDSDKKKQIFSIIPKIRYTLTQKVLRFTVGARPPP